MCIFWYNNNTLQFFLVTKFQTDTNFFRFGLGLSDVILFFSFHYASPYWSSGFVFLILYFSFHYASPYWLSGFVFLTTPAICDLRYSAIWLKKNRNRRDPNPGRLGAMRARYLQTTAPSYHFICIDRVITSTLTLHLLIIYTLYITRQWPTSCSLIEDLESVKDQT